jgi:hypothetical protein
MTNEHKDEFDHQSLTANSGSSRQACVSENQKQSQLWLHADEQNALMISIFTKCPISEKTVYCVL